MRLESAGPEFTKSPLQTNTNPVINKQLAQLALATSEGTLRRTETSSKIIAQLSDCGDLHSLSKLNDLGLAGASEAYNGIATEPVFADLFEVDHFSDGASVTSGSSRAESSIDGNLFLSKGDANDGNNDDQNLDESVFTGRKTELHAFLDLMERFGKAERVPPLIIYGPAGIGKTA